MAKGKKKGTKYADETKIIANKTKRLNRHLRNHPNDAQSQSSLKKVTVQGGKKPTGRGLRVERELYSEGSQIKVFVNIGGRALAEDHVSMRNNKIKKAVVNGMKHMPKEQRSLYLRQQKAANDAVNAKTKKAA